MSLWYFVTVPVTPTPMKNKWLSCVLLTFRLSLYQNSSGKFILVSCRSRVNSNQRVTTDASVNWNRRTDLLPLENKSNFGLWNTIERAVSIVLITVSFVLKMDCRDTVFWSLIQWRKTQVKNSNKTLPSRARLIEFGSEWVLLFLRPFARSGRETAERTAAFHRTKWPRFAFHSNPTCPTRGVRRRECSFGSVSVAHDFRERKSVAECLAACLACVLMVLF